MTQEEKAKAYDKAIKEAAIAYKDEDKHLKATLERIFPKLKESEDKKIKEQVIYAIEQLHVCGCTKDKLRAWVEKQESVGEIVERCRNSWFFIKKAKLWLAEIHRVCDITDEHGYRIELRELQARFENYMKGE